MTDRDNVDWEAFEASLRWRPIADYDRGLGRPELLRAGEDEAIGYWDDGWWHAQESLDDQRLSFEPIEFAAVDDAWRVHLMAD